MPAVPDRALADRLEIIDRTARIWMLVDARDWEALPVLFTDPVEVDFTSLTGGEPRTVAPAALVAGWRVALEGLQATPHLIAGHVIDLHGPDEATCAANVQAAHVLANEFGGPLWLAGGRYDVRLRRGEGGWRVCALRFTFQWGTGNQHVMQLARQAAGA